MLRRIIASTALSAAAESSILDCASRLSRRLRSSGVSIFRGLRVTGSMTVQRFAAGLAAWN